MDALFIVLLVILGGTALGLVSLVVYVSRMDKKPTIEEPVAEEQPVEEPIAEEQLEAEPDEEENPEVEEEEQEIKEISENGITRIVVIRYNKSFTAKLIQSDDKVKYYYSELKNHLLSYTNVKNRISWKWETFRLGKKMIAKLRMRGKTLSIVLALDPAQFENSKYLIESIAEIASYSDTPSLYRIKNDRRLHYAKELIDKLFADEGVEVKKDYSSIDYAKELPYEATPDLIKRELIKENTVEKVAA